MCRRAGFVGTAAILLSALACAPGPVSDATPSAVSATSPPATTGTTATSTTRPTPGATPGTAGTAGTATPPGTGTPSALHWTGCGQRVQCATLRVPRDWARPDGETLDLAVARRPATGPGERIGTLFFNPGGPGAPGTAYVQGASLDPELNRRFDIVSWDPRGVGGSAPVNCDGHTDAYRELDWSPDDPAEQAQLESAAAAIAADCAAAHRDELDEVGTDATARDLDALRAAVGDEQVSFIGFSYGTYIGLRYAELFAPRVRAMVLDGVVDPTQDLAGLLAGQTQALETHMDAVFASCATQRCPVADAAATYDRVAQAVERAPLPAGSDPPVGPTALAFAAISSSYDAHGRDSFLEALAAADDGDGTPLRQLADAYWATGSFTSYLAILCADSPHPVGGEAYRDLATELRAISPRFGDAMANEVLACAFWDAPPAAPRAAVRAPGSAPILVIGNTGDVATPLESAQRVAHDLDAGVLLTYDGQGHTSFGKSTCVDNAIRAYLVELTLPGPSGSC